MPHRYLPHTPDDLRKMLSAVGAKEVNDLFEAVPGRLRARAKLDLPEGLGEPALKAHLLELAGRVNVPEPEGIFLGGGAYNHFQPGVGHFGVFSGRRWRNEIMPQVREFILDNDRRD